MWRGVKGTRRTRAENGLPPRLDKLPSRLITTYNAKVDRRGNRTPDPLSLKRFGVPVDQSYHWNGLPTIVCDWPTTQAIVWSSSRIVASCQSEVIVLLQSLLHPVNQKWLYLLYFYNHCCVLSIRSDCTCCTSTIIVEKHVKVYLTGCMRLCALNKKKRHPQSKTNILSGGCRGQTNQTPNHRFGGVGIKPPRAGPRSQPLTVAEVRS